MTASIRWPDASDTIAAVRSKTWLLLGKGPTATLPRPYGVPVMSLNHACGMAIADGRLDAAFFVDLSPVVDCSAALASSPCPVILPWRPHVDMRPYTPGLPALLATTPVLSGLLAAGRLSVYRSTTSPDSPGDPAVRRVRVRLFSAVGAVNLLVASGVRHIILQGVDGGSEYAPAFDRKDLLANGRSSFDSQFAEFRRTLSITPGLRFSKASPVTGNDHVPERQSLLVPFLP